MKKIITTTLVSVLVFSLFGCNKKIDAPPATEKSVEKAAEPKKGPNPVAWGWEKEPMPDPKKYKNKF